MKTNDAKKESSYKEDVEASVHEMLSRHAAQGGELKLYRVPGGDLSLSPPVGFVNGVPVFEGSGMFPAWALPDSICIKDAVKDAGEVIEVKAEVVRQEPQKGLKAGDLPNTAKKKATAAKKELCFVFSVHPGGTTTTCCSCLQDYPVSDVKLGLPNFDVCPACIIEGVEFVAKNAGNIAKNWVKVMDDSKENRSLARFFGKMATKLNQFKSFNEIPGGKTASQIAALTMLPLVQKQYEIVAHKKRGIA